MKRYNTPHRSRVVKTRMTEEEYAEFAERLSAYHMSQAEYKMSRPNVQKILYKNVQLVCLLYVVF